MNYYTTLIITFCGTVLLQGCETIYPTRQEIKEKSRKNLSEQIEDSNIKLINIDECKNNSKCKLWIKSWNDIKNKYEYSKSEDFNIFIFDDSKSSCQHPKVLFDNNLYLPISYIEEEKIGISDQEYIFSILCHESAHIRLSHIDLEMRRKYKTTELKFSLPDISTIRFEAPTWSEFFLKLGGTALDIGLGYAAKSMGDSPMKKFLLNRNSSNFNNNDVKYVSFSKMGFFDFSREFYDSDRMEFPLREEIEADRDALSCLKKFGFEKRSLIHSILSKEKKSQSCLSEKASDQIRTRVDSLNKI